MYLKEKETQRITQNSLFNHKIDLITTRQYISITLYKMTEDSVLSEPTVLPKPQLFSSRETETTLYFTLGNVNTSIANSLRRLILMDIPAVVMKTFPHSENQVDIQTNTTRHTNEIIKQRLGSIPIHIKDLSTPIDQLVLKIDKQNTSDTVEYITTDDIEIINKNTETSLDQDEIRRIFPHDAITNEPILIARLRPRIREEGQGETLTVHANLSISTANESGMYAQVATCGYAMTVDPDTQTEEWERENVRLQEEAERQGTNYSQETLEFEKQNWLLGKGKRYTIPNHFDFKIESVGVYSNNELVRVACDAMIGKLERLENSIQEQTIQIKSSESALNYGFDITLDGEDYTVGKAIEYALYEMYYQGRVDQRLSFVGFQKFHPHDKHSMIRIGFREETDYGAMINVFRHAIQEVKNIFTSIQNIV